MISEDFIAGIAYGALYPRWASRPRHHASRDLDDYVSVANPVRAVDVFVDGLVLVIWILKVPFQPRLAGLLTTPQSC